MITEKDLNIMKSAFKIGMVYIQYVPKDTEYLVTGFIKAKQDDGLWKDGLSYINENDSSETYVRTFEQLEHFKYSKSTLA